MMYSNCASIKGKGNDFAFEYLDHMLRSWLDKYGETGYIVQLDFKGYFASINNKKIFNQLKRYVFDEEVLDVIAMFFDNEYGLSLGNELSQIPASFFPNPVDHVIQSKFACPYVRFMDDTLFLVKTKEEIKPILDEVFAICEREELVINPSKIIITSVGKPFVFCKQHYKLKDGKVIRSLARERIHRNAVKMRKLQCLRARGSIDHVSCRNNIKCIIGMIASKPNIRITVEKLMNEFFT